MKRKILLVMIATAIVFCLSMTACAGGGEGKKQLELRIEENEAITADDSAADFVAKIKIGWNLGNTLDAHPGEETSWGNPKTTKEMFAALKGNGFNTIRIPVSWAKKAPKPDYTINAAWMTRVKEVVDYAMDNNLYVILNTHHDEAIFKFMDSEMAESKKAFQTIWEQIADTFKDYNYNLIFEGLNEPRTIGSAKEWQGGTAEEHKNLNEMHQIFVDTIRASGGNNVKRLLMISTYAASTETDAVNGLVLPDDIAENSSVKKFIVSTHSYSPYNFALNEDKRLKTWSATNAEDTSPITDWIDRVNTKFVSKGIPVIGGEFGALGKDNEPARAAWAEYYVSKAGEKGIKCVWWDDGGNFKLFNRSAKNFYFPAIHEGLMLGAGVVVFVD